MPNDCCGADRSPGAVLWHRGADPVGSDWWGMPPPCSCSRSGLGTVLQVLSA